ncbi:MAG TPA: hypothetical protein VG253_20675 [Streptosporangiaceae bacterium]|nr:hypothetical protein [Streptosporangiaceae bacterium]
MTWTTVFAIALLITLAVLGHGVWHSGTVAVFNFLTGLFTGAHVVG